MATAGFITVDLSLAMPPFEQIKLHITNARASQELPALYRLPPVRQLAAELGLAPNTVARAYRELEAEAVIETRGRQGSFITAASQGAFTQAVAAASEYVSRVRALGLSDVDAQRMLNDTLNRGTTARPQNPPPG